MPGCATLARGTKQKVTIASNPSGATVTHERAKESWTTPATIELPRNRRHDIVVSMPGYTPASVYVRSEANIGWWIFDAFSLGVGNLIDALAGGLFDLQPESVHVVLERETEAPTVPQ
jgi:hypothetical protein